MYANELEKSKNDISTYFALMKDGNNELKIKYKGRRTVDKETEGAMELC